MVAASRGVVTVSETLRGYGNVLMIDHGSSRMTVYTHLRSALVKKGQTVQKGQQSPKWAIPTPTGSSCISRSAWAGARSIRVHSWPTGDKFRRRNWVAGPNWDCRSRTECGHPGIPVRVLCRRPIAGPKTGGESRAMR